MSAESDNEEFLDDLPRDKFITMVHTEARLQRAEA